MRLIEFITEDTGQYVYHATKAENLGKIMQNGLTFFNDSLWVKADTGNRYQDQPGVFAFENPLPAFRWGHKIEWEFKTPAVIIKFKKGSSWQDDPSADIMMTMGDGKALMSLEAIPASDIKGVILLNKIGTPMSTGLANQEFDQHVKQTLEQL